MGKALESPFFDDYDVPPAIKLPELLSSAPSRRRTALKRVEFMARQAGEQQAQAIFTKTIKEVAQGTMGGPYTHTELVRRHGPHYNVIPSFGLEQGVDESNKPKFRRINDHTAGFTNLAAHRRQKIAMSMADYLVVMIKAMYNNSRCSLTVGTEDMKQAYRQIPLLDSQTSLAVTAIYNPHTQQPELHEIYGQPFGARHSVPNFYRTAEWLNRVMIRAYKVMLDHFFDDFYYVERPACGKVTMFCLQQAFQPLGFSLDSEKTQVPSEVAYVLGVAFNTRVLHSERQLKVEPKPLRVQNFTVVLIDAILRRKALPPSVAASVLGKFGFLCSTLFGKLGRFCTAALRERQYSNTSSTHLTPAIILSLKLMKHVVQIAPPPSLPAGPTTSPHYSLHGRIRRPGPRPKVRARRRDDCSISKLPYGSFLRSTP